jgi:hypothetical protein
MLPLVLGEVVAIIDVAVALTIIGTALFGSPALSERAFRLPYWIRNRSHRHLRPVTSAMAACTSGAADLPGRVARKQQKSR